MKYRNKKTGAVVDVPSALGGNWELIDGGKSAPVVLDAPVEAVEEVKPVKKTTRKTAKKTKK